MRSIGELEIQIVEPQSVSQSMWVKHVPGRQGLSDFTVADELKVEIAGVALTHRLYQFALAYSGWRHATVIDSG
jgi:hypothetical protein